MATRSTRRRSCPGARTAATSHSGVSLAAGAQLRDGPWMSGLSEAPPDFDVFKGDRLADPQDQFLP